MSEGNFMPPVELAKAFVGIGQKKASLPFGKMFVLSLLAGIYIGFAAHLATTVGTGAWQVVGLKKLMVGAAFTVGLMLVVIPGAELFTGNNLMSVALFDRQIGLGGLMKNWVTVYIGNLIGSILLALMIAKGTGLLGGAVGGTAIKIAYNKVTGGLSHNWDFFFRAIGCNVLVCLAVMMAIAAKDIAGKIWAIFFPIMAFVASGFEHCVANMYFIPAGIWAKSFAGARTASGLTPAELDSINLGTMWTNNLISVTLGNMVGGVLFVGLAYFYAHVKTPKTANSE
jgi:formate/nitrite transporter